ncbi:MAG: hypothetical protein M3457_14600 [Chloroflexota bacterium]|nr:hypothetical protein [Chloroflexota bacterium]
MRLSRTLESHQIRRAGAAAMLGGLLWIPYGVFEMLKPWGVDTVYRDDRGYELVTDSLLYWVYNLPGSLALFLSTLGLLGAFTMPGLSSGRTGGLSRILVYTALTLAVLSVVGVVTQFDPLFTAPRIFGTLALGTATFLAGVNAHRAGAAPVWTISLLALGLLGLFLLPLWPLVHAIEVMPESGGAGIIALFGLGWGLLGHRIRSRPSLAASSSPSR